MGSDGGGGGRALRAALLALVLLLAVSALAAGFGVYVVRSATARYDRTWDVAVADIPVPWPLSDEDLDALENRERDKMRRVLQSDGGGEWGALIEGSEPLAWVDTDSLTREVAIERGGHIVQTRTTCLVCHGADGGGRVYVESPMAGVMAAPNITSGGVVADYTVADWVRIIRHGVGRDGTTSAMPSEPYAQWADRDLSDMIAYLRTLPAVDSVQPATRPGPLYALLLWRGDLTFAAEQIDHDAVRPRLPPEAAPTPELGAYLASTCARCHGASLSGGTVPGIAGQLPMAPNLTFHESGLAGWTLEQLTLYLRTGRAPDGSESDPELMPWPVYNGMSNVEIEAIYTYLQSLPPAPFGG